MINWNQKCCSVTLLKGLGERQPSPEQTGSTDVRENAVCRFNRFSAKLSPTIITFRSHEFSALLCVKIARTRVHHRRSPDFVALPSTT